MNSLVEYAVKNKRNENNGHQSDGHDVVPTLIDSRTVIRGARPFLHAVASYEKGDARVTRRGFAPLNIDRISPDDASQILLCSSSRLKPATDGCGKDSNGAKWSLDEHAEFRAELFDRSPVDVVRDKGVDYFNTFIEVIDSTVYEEEIVQDGQSKTNCDETLRGIARREEEFGTDQRAQECDTGKADQVASLRLEGMSIASDRSTLFMEVTR